MDVAPCNGVVEVLPTLLPALKECAGCFTLTSTGSLFVLCVGIPVLTCGICYYFHMKYRHAENMELLRMRERELQREDSRRKLQIELKEQTLQKADELKKETEEKRDKYKLDLCELRIKLHDEREKLKLEHEKERKILETELEDRRQREQDKINREIRLKELEVEMKRIELEHEREIRKIELGGYFNSRGFANFELQRAEAAAITIQQFEDVVNDPTELLMPALQQLAVRNN